MHLKEKQYLKEVKVNELFLNLSDHKVHRYMFNDEIRLRDFLEGLLTSFKASSAVTFFLFLQSNIPNVGLSVLSFTNSSTALK